MDTDVSRDPRRFRPSYRRDELKALTGLLTAVELTPNSTNLVSWSWNDFVALCCANRAVWLNSDVCVCYKYKQGFPPEKFDHGHHTSWYTISFPDCAPYFQHLHIFGKDRGAVVFAVCAILEVMSRSTVEWMALGSLNATNKRGAIKKPLPFSKSLKSLLEKKEATSRLETAIFWNLYVGASIEMDINRRGLVNVEFRDCLFANDKMPRGMRYLYRSEESLVNEMMHCSRQSRREKRRKLVEVKYVAEGASAESDCSTKRLEVASGGSTMDQGDKDDESYFQFKPRWWRTSITQSALCKGSRKRSRCTKPAESAWKSRAMRLVLVGMLLYLWYSWREDAFDGGVGAYQRPRHLSEQH